MEEGHVICTDGYKQVIERRNNSKTENKTKFGFSNKQIEGLSALGQHMATQIRSEMQGSNDMGGIQADQVDAFAHVPALTQGQQERQSVFKRVGAANTVEISKRTKYEGFMNELSQHE